MRRRKPRRPKMVQLPADLPPPAALTVYEQYADRPLISTVDGGKTADGWFYVAGVQEPGAELRAYAGPFASWREMEDTFQELLLWVKPAPERQRQPKPKRRKQAPSTAVYTPVLFPKPLRLTGPSPVDIQRFRGRIIKVPDWPDECGQECIGRLGDPPYPPPDMPDNPSMDQFGQRAMCGAVCTLTRDLAPEVRREAMDIVREILREAYTADRQPIPAWLQEGSAHDA